MKKEKRSPWDECERNVRLGMLEYIIEIGGIDKMVERLYADVKDEEDDDWYVHRVLQKARDAGYLPCGEEGPVFL